MSDPTNGGEVPEQRSPGQFPPSQPPSAPGTPGVPPPPYGTAPYGSPPPSGPAPSQYGQPGQYGQQGQWGQPDPYRPYPGATAVNPYDQKATTVLVLGILGLVFCGVLGIIAWVQGNNLRDEAKAAGYPEPSNGQIGRILGMVATGLMAAGLVLMLVWFVFVIALAGSSSGY